MSAEGGPARRLARIRHTLSGRLATVRCAIQAVHHRHNVSAILRTCDALGIFTVDLVEGHFKPIKGTARGAERWLDLHHHEDPESAVQAIRDAGFRLAVADLAPGAVAPEELPVDAPICLWFGAELEGVHPAALEAADHVVRVPMHGMAQSLNVSVAAAVVLRPVAEAARAQLGREALLDEPTREVWWRRWIEREKALEETAASLEAWRWSDPAPDPSPSR